MNEYINDIESFSQYTRQIMYIFANVTCLFLNECIGITTVFRIFIYFPNFIFFWEHRCDFKQTRL